MSKFILHVRNIYLKSLFIFFGLCYSASELFNIKPIILDNDYRSLTNQKVTVTINPHFNVTNINFNLKDQNGRFFRVEIYEGNYHKRWRSTDFVYENISDKCIFKMMTNFSSSDLITLNITYDDTQPVIFYDFQCLKSKPLIYGLFTFILTLYLVSFKVLTFFDVERPLFLKRLKQKIHMLGDAFIDNNIVQKILTMFLYSQIYYFCNVFEDTLNPGLFLLIIAVIIILDYIELTYISYIVLSFSFILFTQHTEIYRPKTNETQYLPCCKVKIEGGFENDSSIPGELVDLENIIYSPVRIDKCRLCKYNYTAETHSTSRDLVVVIALGRNQEIIPRLRSLRTSGCKAKIILITDNKNSYSEGFINCGVDIVKLKLSNKLGKNQILVLRYVFISQILKNYGHAFDRVLYYDGFDTYFQYDPFENITKDPYAFHVSPERMKHKESGWSRGWAEDLTGVDFDKVFGTNQIYCGGVFLGGVKAMEMVTGLVATIIGRDFDVFATDQIVYDWIFLTQIPNILNLTVTENYNLASVHFTSGDYDDADIGKICYNHTNVCPAVMHQVNRRNELELKFAKACT